MNLIIVLGLFCSGLWLFELFLFCLIFIWMYCCCCCLLFLNRSFTRTPAATCALYTPYTRKSSNNDALNSTKTNNHVLPQIIESKKDHIIWHWNNMSCLRTGTKMWQGQTYYFFGQNIIYCGHSYQILRFVLIRFPIVSE